MSVRRGESFYAILEIDAKASASEVRAAYRRIAWRLHPDRNKQVDAQTRFQRVNEAYATLINPLTRAVYDKALQAGAHTDPSAPSPICCSECGRATAQPRILVFQSAISVLVWTRRRFIEGIFCADCARRTALRASMLSALTGWWAPLGPFLTLAAIANNAAGGGRRAESDQRLLLLNAEAFLAKSNTTLAYALARKVSQSSDAPLSNEANKIMGVLQSMGVSRGTAALLDPWRPSLPHLAAHVGLALIGPAAALVAFAVWRGGL